MNKYIELLDEAYQESKAQNECCKNKLQFLSSYIFDITTYDGNMDEVFATIVLKSLKAILTKTTFDYIDKSTTNYFNFLVAVNIPFVYQMLEWGMSIRGAWLDYWHQDEPYHIFDNGHTQIIVIPEDIDNFIEQLIKWSEQ